MTVGAGGELVRGGGRVDARWMLAGSSVVRLSDWRSVPIKGP
jgi:hypothetical protein